MHFAVVARSLISFIPLFLSCDKSPEPFPSSCNCQMDAWRVSEPSFITYQVDSQADASIFAISYQTAEGKVTVTPDSLPFRLTVALDKGDTIMLAAVGTPKNGSIILGYEITEKNTVNPASMAASRVWIAKNGSCQ